MTVQTGRSVPEFVELKIGSAASDMQSMKINSLGDLGLTFEKIPMSAWGDAIKGYFVGKPDFELEFGGPVDNTATTGPSTLLRAWAAAPYTLLSFDLQLGVRHDWETGEQQFGITGVIATNSGAHLIEYLENMGLYKAKICMFPGSVAAPAFFTTAETKPA